MATLHHLVRRRLYTSAAAILNPSDPSAILTSYQKSRAALSLLRSSPALSSDHILSICRAAALSPTTHLDRLALSVAVSSLSKKPESAPTLRSLIDGLPKSPRSLAHSIVLYGQGKLLDDAFHVFTSIPSPTVRHLNSLLFACILAGNHPEAARIFRDFPVQYDITPNLETYNTIIKSFCESGYSRSVFSLFDEMLRKKIKPNLTTFTHWLSGLYKDQRFDDVPKVLQLMKKNDSHPGVLSIYNVRIHGLCKLGKAAEAKELFKQMIRNGMKPNWVTYGHMIYGFAKEGDLEESKKLYKEMISRGCTPDSSCYFTLMHYLCLGGDFDAALDVCKESMKRDWIPCFKMMKLLVDGLVSKSKVEEAREIIEKVKEKFSSKADMWKEVEESLPQ
ncbi:HCP-like protein [Dioscorea alata]|uniref:HCP-like protein n=1 Tax=Dioscorea alata TaxID=55571 RepID=A0ACB7UNT6_DIOAL|nr:HCP-like protein [Dioscorea alata]